MGKREFSQYRIFNIGLHPVRTFKGTHLVLLRFKIKAAVSRPLAGFWLFSQNLFLPLELLAPKVLLVALSAGLLVQSWPGYKAIWSKHTLFESCQ